MVNVEIPLWASPPVVEFFALDNPADVYNSEMEQALLSLTTQVILSCIPAILVQHHHSIFDF
eukprot:950116-Amorphochlora_amoeboformis.AAC.2